MRSQQYSCCSCNEWQHLNFIHHSISMLSTGTFPGLHVHYHHKEDWFQPRILLFVTERSFPECIFWRYYLRPIFILLHWSVLDLWCHPEGRSVLNKSLPPVHLHDQTEPLKFHFGCVCIGYDWSYAQTDFSGHFAQMFQIKLQVTKPG